jgi:thymidylate synthase
MAVIFSNTGLADIYPRLCHDLLDGGSDVRPRGKLTKELLDVTIQIEDPADVRLDAVNRARYKPAIGVAEGLLLIAGVSDPALMTRISPAFKAFTDGGAFHGAYGPRLRFQLPRAIERLAADRDTRQAVVTIWDPLHDGAEPEQDSPRDLPCTVYLNLRIRDGKLTLKTHMRSNDAWLGLPYDVTQFTLLQRTIADVLGLPAGPYVHHVDSLHLYEGHWDSAEQTHAPTSGYPSLGGLTAATWSQARLLAMELLYEDLFWGEDTPEARLSVLINRYL